MKAWHMTVEIPDQAMCILTRMAMRTWQTATFTCYCMRAM